MKSGTTSTLSTSLARAQKKAVKQTEALAKVDIEQRSELLKLAGIGTASQARAIRAAFSVMERALQAETKVKVGKQFLTRPLWDIRVTAARALWDMLGVTVKKAVGSGATPERTTVNIVQYAVPEPARAVVVDVAQDVTQDVTQDDAAQGQIVAAEPANESHGYSAAFKMMLDAHERTSERSGSDSGLGLSNDSEGIVAEAASVS